MITARAILFDYDDTLVKTRETKAKLIMDMGAKYDVQISEDHIELHWGEAYKTFFANVFGRNDSSVDEIIKEYENRNSEFPIVAHDHCISTVAKLIKKMPVGIVTAAGRNIVLNQLKSINFPYQELFIFQTAEDTAYHKPDPRVFEPSIMALKQREINRNEILYIGDSDRDYKAARDAGMQFLGIARTSSETKCFEEIQAPYIKSIEKLLSLI